MQPIPDDIAGLSYEQAIEELEAIMDDIESGEAGLEASLQASQRATLLIRHCRAILDQVRTRVAELTRDAEGQLVEDPDAAGLEELEEQD